MTDNDKYVGCSMDYLYIWDSKYGWVHSSEKEKLQEAYERFKEEES